MIWTDALSAANTLPAATAPAACGAMDGSVAGDRRLPKANELPSPIDYGHVGPALPPRHPFAGLQSSRYCWSSTSAVDAEEAAWCVDLLVGDFSGALKSEPYPDVYVWPVRPGQ